VSVGRREWQRICQAEGIPDGLNEVTKKAREFMKKGGGTTAETLPTISTDMPPMGDKPQGVPNPMTTPTKPTQPAPKPAAYIPDYSERDDANDAIDDALESITRLMNGADKAIRDAENKLGSVDNAGDELELNEAIRTMKSAQTELSSLKGRVVNYGSAIDTAPAPRNRNEQVPYDLAMQRYAASAKAVAKSAERKYGSAKRRMDYALSD
jgi:hypothetical protein